MAFRFKLEESVTKGFRRIAREQVELALAELNADRVQPGGVHSCRKAIKRLRALLRLVAPALGEKTARRRNASLRDIGRLLSERRDQAVLVQTLDKLRATATIEEADALAPLIRHFDAKVTDYVGPLDPNEATRAGLQLLREARRFAAAKLRGRGFAALSDGLHASYKGGRRALRKARLEPSDEAFHELRKAVQAHWRQMSLLSRTWPEAVEVRVAAARELSQMLGDDHDLAMLRAAAAQAPELSPAQVEAIGAICAGRQNDLRRRTLARADRLYAEKPAAFVRRMDAYWRAAREIASSQPAPQRQAVAAPANAGCEQQPAATVGSGDQPLKVEPPAGVATKATSRPQSQRRA